MNKNMRMWVSMLGIAAVVVGLLCFQQYGSHTEALLMREVFAAGKSQKCTLTQTAGTVTASGTVYTRPGQLRGDFTAVSNGQTMHSHMISDGQTSYIWGDDSPTGYKVTAAQTGGASVLGPDVKAAFRCMPWLPSATLFTVPTDITFPETSPRPSAPTPSSAPLTSPVQ